MFTDTNAEPASYQENPLPDGATRSRPTTADARFEFRRFRVLLRRRQLVADGMPIELGTRAFDLLLVLLDADGSLVTKGELLSRAWPGIVVAEDNLKFRSPHCARLLAKTVI
jgi:DNA-binding winged helix-turn-helix (wHTH) protein